MAVDTTNSKNTLSTRLIHTTTRGAAPREHTELDYVAAPDPDPAARSPPGHAHVHHLGKG